MNERIAHFKMGADYIFKSIFGKVPNKLNIEENRRIDVLEKNGFKHNSTDSEFGVTKNAMSFWLRKNSSDFYVFEELFIGGEYLGVCELVDLNHINVKTIVDIGSNIGLAALYFKGKFSNSTIYCVEPDPSNFLMLQRNTEQLNNVSAYNYAVWSHNSSLKLGSEFRDGLNWSKSVLDSNEGSPNGKIEVTGITLDDFIANNGIQAIDILKVDIEGAEFEVILNSPSRNFLQISKIIVLEVHAEVGDIIEIQKVLLNYDYFLIKYGETIIGIKKWLIK